MQKKLTSPSLLEVARHLDAIIENSFDGIFITDKDARVLRTNHAYELITGLHKDELIGHTMDELVKRGLISQSGSLYVVKNLKPITIQQQFKSGKEALVTSSPIFDSNGNLTMIVTNVRDLSEIYNLKKAVQEKKQTLERLRQELDHFKNGEENQDLIMKDETALSSLLLANRVAPMDTTVILFGETGVGKEVMARYIYQHSRRAENSFIKVNCGAIPENLIESELFGYEGGAFTGANRAGKIGLFELANKGTLFLDEVGELPKDMQVKLLRVLQEQEIMRIGGTKAIKVDTRIIAATNRNLEKMVKSGDFREDLYYRLTVFPISIPPLRARPKDITPLSLSFLEKLNKKYNFKKIFTSMSLQLLNEYDWPGNIRELKNIIERAVIISSGNKIEPENLHIYSKNIPSSISSPSYHFHQRENIENSPNIPFTPTLLTPVPEENHLSLPTHLNETLEKIEYTYLTASYKKYGNVRTAAKALGMTASTFVRKRKLYEEKHPDTTHRLVRYK